MTERKFFPDILDDFRIAVEIVIERMFNLNMVDVTSSSKKGDLEITRQMIFSSAKCIIKKRATVSEIGSYFGGFKERSIKNKIQNHNAMIRKNGDYRSNYKDFRDAIVDNMQRRKRG